MLFISNFSNNLYRDSSMDLDSHGFDYSPVNTFAFRRNDTYFYASFFREICQSGFIFNSQAQKQILQV